MTLIRLFLDILKKTQGQKKLKDLAKLKGFFQKLKEFSKNSSFRQLLNFEIAAKKKPKFFSRLRQDSTGQSLTDLWKQ